MDRMEPLFKAKWELEKSEKLILNKWNKIQRVYEREPTNKQS